MKRLLFAVIVLVSIAAIAADEIALTASLRVQNGEFSLTRSVGSYVVDQTGKNMSYGIANVSTSTNALVVSSDVGTGGYSWFRNLGTNTAIVRVYLKLKASDVALLRVASTNITAYTTSGSSQVEYWVNEE